MTWLGIRWKKSRLKTFFATFQIREHKGMLYGRNKSTQKLHSQGGSIVWRVGKLHFLLIILINSRYIRKYFSEVSDQNSKYFLSYSPWRTERTRGRWARLGSLKAIFSKRYFFDTVHERNKYWEIYLTVLDFWTGQIFPKILYTFYDEA